MKSHRDHDDHAERQDRRIDGAGHRWHALTQEQALTALRSTAAGLVDEEVGERRARHGANELPAERRRSRGAILLAQLRSPLVYLLVAAATLATALGKHEDAAVILVVVCVNAGLGALQEGRAERSMASLRRLAALRVRVCRGGRETEVAARELVPGDVLVLAAGDAVGADARLLHAASLAAAEAALTGESVPVTKNEAALPADTQPADRRNMVWSGTHVTAGRGRAVVVATGADTQVGHIARLTAAAVEPRTPLEARMDQFGRWLAVAAVAMFAVVMVAGLVRGMPAGEIFMVAVSQMVSMVPEGLPVALTIALAVGMQRMADQGAIVRRLAAVETLGSTDVICSDKTGTLTRNEMTVTEVWLPGGGAVPIGARAPTADPGGLAALLEAGALCNDARIPPGGAGVGDPTELALLAAAQDGGCRPERLRAEWPRRGELPFDPAHKLMATAHAAADGRRRVVLKGAPEMLLPLCRADGAAALAAADDMAARALRVLAVADVDGADLDPAAGFAQFAGRARLLGLVGQIDPPRPAAKAAVAACRRAGVRTVMVTGDHKHTGLAIAHQLGIAAAGDRAIDGAELAAMSEHELAAAIDQIAVFARVHPAQKLRIVTALQARGHVVAMTGDGVNDAPALARANVGVAMGRSGTEVAKSAARIVLTDDDFATVVKAVEQGRLVHANIQKLLLFLFSTSIDEVIVLLLAVFGGLPLPLAAVQILWINLVTEGTLTVNLVMEGAEGDELARPPIRADAPLVSRAMLARMALLVPTSVAVTFGYYVWRLGSGAPFAAVQTETFTLLANCQWFNAANCQSATRSALGPGVLANRWLLGGLVLANLLQFAVVYAEPMNRVFHTVPIDLAHFLLIGLCASTVLWVEEARKWWVRRARHGGQPG